MLGGSGSVPGRVAGADFDTPALYRLPIENSQDFPKRVLDLIIQTVGVMHHERWFRAFACDAGRPDWLLPSGVERRPSRECSHEPAPEYPGNYQSDYNSQKYNRHPAPASFATTLSEIALVAGTSRGTSSCDWFALPTGVRSAAAPCVAPVAGDGGSGQATLVAPADDGGSGHATVSVLGWRLA